MSQVQLRLLRTHDLTTAWGHAVALVFHQAFNSAPHWNRAAWPLGTPKETGTVAHTLHSFAERGYSAHVLTEGEGTVLSFVIAGFLTADCIRDYGLVQFGAKLGEGFIPFIGVCPERRSQRVEGQGRELQLCPPCSGPTKPGTSLIRRVFDESLTVLDAASDCVWSRTRSVLLPVQRIFTDNGFVERGRFDYMHRGTDPQDRIVYSRTKQ